jgi:hypothetical protein
MQGAWGRGSLVRSRAARQCDAEENLDAGSSSRGALSCSPPPGIRGAWGCGSHVRSGAARQGDGEETPDAGSSWRGAPSCSRRRECRAPGGAVRWSGRGPLGGAAMRRSGCAIYLRLNPFSTLRADCRTAAAAASAARLLQREAPPAGPKEKLRRSTKSDEERNRQSLVTTGIAEHAETGSLCPGSPALSMVIAPGSSACWNGKAWISISYSILCAHSSAWRWLLARARAPKLGSCSRGVCVAAGSP